MALALRRHLRLIAMFGRVSLQADLEYRLNFVVRVVTDMLWYGAQILTFEILFRQTSQISGWSLLEMRVFLGLLFTTDALYMFLFSENLDHLSDKVRKGDLDLILCKPVNSQFMMSFQKLSVAYLACIAISLSWLVWSIAQLPGETVWHRLPILLLTAPGSLAVVYSMRFIFSATALIFTRAENINYLWYQIFKLGTRPDALYPRWLRYIVLTFIPVGFVASVPAQIVLGKLEWFWLFGGLVVPVFAVGLSIWFWRFGLRFYTSASS
jgi:ABC-2 type transport system permease protein